jgi:hypothetical protein
MNRLIQLGLAVAVVLGFAAHFDSADARKRERDRFGFYDPYFGNDVDDRFRYRTERRGAYDKGARAKPPSRLERNAYSYRFE